MTDNPDRTVHARATDGWEVVRYERSGKWWVEHPSRPGQVRVSLTLADAVGWAEEPGAEVFYGLPGGKAFDAAARRSALKGTLDA